MFSNIGLALDVHFCGDAVVASELVFLQKTDDFCTHKDINHQNHSAKNHTTEKSCCGISDNHSDCCKDEYITQENPDVVFVKSISVNLGNILITENTYVFDFVTSISNKNVFFSSNDGQLIKIPLYKRYCQFVFYA